MKKKIKLFQLFKLHRYGRTVCMIKARLLVIIFLNYYIIKFSKYMAAQVLTQACPILYQMCIYVTSAQVQNTVGMITGWSPLCIFVSWD